ncbi:helicase C-terminal domain-containing protein, partial [bacterium]|nr:helicase C-terminal domain-containing protein [bacterium]
YKNPPDFLLGTVDKFAGVPFTERAGEIFGAAREKGVKRSPPSLIIQDELHLISGPLGTLASVYEAAFDTLIKQYQSHIGLPPVGAKYVASSATVRDSEKQIQRLMGRGAQIFPPRGMRSDDSFFAREDRRSDFARLYVGLMPQGVRATTAAHWTSAALLQAVRYVGESKLSSREEVDFLWSLLCYCNSKRELGLINGAVAQEITERQRVYGSRQNFNDEYYEQFKKQEVSSEAVKDVSATRSGLLVGVVQRTDSPDVSASRKVVDFVPCTNMISVGVDIDRLGLMLVNGQPKTTAEYIQATSRVGRNPDKQGPGLVVTLYSPAKPRDRSHYEYFKNYHSSLYRLVEPNSVTPGSLRALRRAAHAAVVTVVRHGVTNMSNNDAASTFDSNSTDIKKILEQLQTRLLNAYTADDDYERGVIQHRLREVVNEWEEWAAQGLRCYAPGGKNEPGLLKNTVQPAASDMGWLTNRSMRGVDVEVPGKVR